MALGRKLFLILRDFLKCLQPQKLPVCQVSSSQKVPTACVVKLRIRPEILRQRLLSELQLRIRPEIPRQRLLSELQLRIRPEILRQRLLLNCNCESGQKSPDSVCCRNCNCESGQKSPDSVCCRNCIFKSELQLRIRPEIPRWQNLRMPVPIQQRPRKH